MADENYENRLQQLWQQGHRNMAVAFLRRAISMETTLAEVAAALQFPEVRDFVDGIRLRDVLAPAAVRPATATPASAPASAARPATKRRRRRGPREMQEIKGELLRMLRAEPGSLDTTQLFESLAKIGHELDRITLNRLLSQLEEERHVTCLGGRPKGWRAVTSRQAMREASSLSLG